MANFREASLSSQASLRFASCTVVKAPFGLV
jgi:hypothetical protein